MMLFFYMLTAHAAASRTPLFSLVPEEPTSPREPLSAGGLYLSSSPEKVKPLAVTISGGGFRSMFGAMGLARGLAEAGGWSHATHIAGNSGGTWFATLLQYSRPFYEDVMAGSTPIDALITSIAQNMMRKADDAVGDAELVTVPEVEFVPSREGRSKALYQAQLQACKSGATFARSVLVSAIIAYAHVTKAVAELWIYTLWENTPFVDWQAFVEKVILDDSVQTDILQPISPFLNVTFLFSAGMMVDTFLDLDSVACLMPQTTNPTSLSWLEPNGASRIEWPAAFVKAGSDVPATSGWRFGSAVDSWSTALIGPTDTCASAQLSETALTPLELPVPSTAFGAAWSSAAAGVMTSPTQERAWGVLPSAALPCYPGTGTPGGGFEQVGPPAMGADQGSVIWRGNDGGTTDNLGVSHVIGRMQDDCEAEGSPLDCSGGLDLIVFDSDSYDFPYGMLRHTFMVPGAGFASNPPGTLRNLYVQDGRNTSQPSSTVFAGEYPPEDQWITGWFAIPPNATDGDYSSIPDDLPAADKPQYWKGKLTTVENPWFGVREGTPINALLIRPQLKQATFLPTGLISSYTQSHYAPTAAAMATQSVPIFRQFFEG
jgi:hypothetical protein